MLDVFQHPSLDHRQSSKSITMGLVDYSSDSEASDAEPQKAPPSTASQLQDSSKSSKASFQKVIDKSNPHKIKVNLPSSTGGGDPDGNSSEAREEGPPAKRARTGGGLSDFNSFLPAPKNPKAIANGTGSGNDALRSRGTGLGRGVNLKTGAQPAFSRAPPDIEEEDQPYTPENGDYSAKNQDAPSQDRVAETSAETMGEIQAVSRKTAMFRPLSVARKPDKKRKKPSITKGTANGEGKKVDSPTNTSKPESIPAAPPPKRSLFASAEPEPETTESSNSMHYQPYFGNDSVADSTEEEAVDSTSFRTPSQAQSQSQPSPTQNLSDLASTLNLTPSQRRQLFGRSGAPTNAAVASFSVSQEYSHNQAVAAEAEANAAAAPKTVRSIAPGKHSLQQLLNQASTQKEALEDSFAQGRKNKREGASRYGWG